MDQPIGIIDSGIGGLSVWQEIASQLPAESVVYLADQKYVPYGPRSAEEITMLSLRLVDFLVKQNVKIIIIACNTISVTCLDVLREKFSGIPIVGTVPVIKKAVEKSKTNQIGLLATKRTVQSSYTKSLIERFAPGVTVITHGTNVLVPFIERNDINSEAFYTLLKQELKFFMEDKVDILVLGSTHFPFIRKEIQSILGYKCLILDSGAAIARQVRRLLESNYAINKNGKSAHATFYTTGSKESFDFIAEELVGRSLHAQMVNI